MALKGGGDEIGLQTKIVSGRNGMTWQSIGIVEHLRLFLIYVFTFRYFCYGVSKRWAERL